MNRFRFTETEIQGVYVIEPAVFEDERGYFMETYNYGEFKEAGLDLIFVQDNHLKSKKGVLRGLHFQRMHAQGKLVRVSKGEMFHVAVDLRENLKTYGKWVGVTLSEENKKQFYMPKGFAHGFLVLSDETRFCYKYTDFCSHEDEDDLLWNDKDINIKWPLDKVEEGELTLSEKDKKWCELKENKFVFSIEHNRGI